MPVEDVANVSIHFEESGSGVPLVLLHAFPLSSKMWSAQREDLATVARVITPDFRGFGQSSSGGPFTIETLADDTHALLAKINALPCVLAGLSMGGYVALAFAEKYADSLRGLVLLDTRADADTAQSKESRQKNIELVRQKGASAIAEAMTARLLAPGAEGARPERVASLKKMIGACSPLAIEHALAAMRDRPDRSATLQSVQCPVAIVVGQGDQLSPPDVARQMQKLVRGAVLHVVQGAGHLTAIEQPAQVTHILRRFVMAIQ